MKNNTVFTEKLEKKKAEGMELGEMLKNVPKEYKDYLYGIVDGFALCAGANEKRREDG